MEEYNSKQQNLKPKNQEKSKNLDEELGEYKRMLDAHHRYTQKIRALSSRGVDSLDENKKSKLQEIDAKRNQLHEDLKKLAQKIGKTPSDIIVDLLLLDGGLKDYGLDLPMVSLDNSPDIAKDQRMKSKMINGEALRIDLQEHQPLEHNEVVLIIGTETLDQFDAEGKTVSTYAIQTEGQEPAVDTFTFSSGFAERITGAKQLIADHPELVRPFATGAFFFHGSTRSYGILMKKADLIDVASKIRDNREKYLPETKSKSIQINRRIKYSVADNNENEAKFSELMSLIPEEMLTYDDLIDRLGEEETEEYLKKRWG